MHACWLTKVGSCQGMLDLTNGFTTSVPLPDSLYDRQTGELRMISAQPNSSAAADATAASPQHFTLVQPPSHRQQQRAIAEGSRARGAATQPLGHPWRGLGLKLVQDVQMAGAAQGAAAPSEAGSTSRRRSRQQPQHMLQAEMAAWQVGTSDMVRRQQEAVMASQLSSLRLTAPLASYPTGSRVLHAANRDFLLVPLSNIVDESYTAYFDMVSRRFPLVVGFEPTIFRL